MHKNSRVFAVAGAKGGVGKTTTSVNIGKLVADRGLSTLVVELDLAMANLIDFVDIDVDVSDDPTLHDVLSGTAAIEAACYEVDENLTFAISGTELTAYADTDLSLLPDVVKTLRVGYDVIILDTPAGLSETTVRPLRLADRAILVSTPRVAAIRNAQNTLELAERLDTETSGLVLTKSGTGASPTADRIAEFLGIDLLGHVPEDDAVPHSQDNGQSVVEYAPNSGAAIAYRKIARNLMAGKTSGIGGQAEPTTDQEGDSTRSKTESSTVEEISDIDGVQSEGTDDRRGPDPQSEAQAPETGGPTPTAASSSDDQPVTASQSFTRGGSETVDNAAPSQDDDVPDSETTAEESATTAQSTGMTGGDDESSHDQFGESTNQQATGREHEEERTTAARQRHGEESDGVDGQRNGEEGDGVDGQRTGEESDGVDGQRNGEEGDGVDRHQNREGTDAENTGRLDGQESTSTEKAGTESTTEQERSQSLVTRLRSIFRR